MASRLGPFLGRSVWRVPLWVAAGLLFWLLGFLMNTEPRSRLRGAELVLLALLLGGMWASAKFDLRKRIGIPRRLAPVAFVALVSLFVIRRTRASFLGTFFFAGGKSLTEGFVLALAIRVVWGLVYSPVATWLFQLPPNP